MIVNETATRSRALDEHSRAKMERKGLPLRVFGLLLLLALLSLLVLG